MTVDINSRYIVVNGWLVDKNAKKVVNHSHRCLRGLSAEHRNRILDQELCDWETLFSSDGLIVLSADAELFNHLCTEEFEFAERDDKKVVLKIPDLMKRNPGHVKRSFTIACHKVCIRAKTCRYLQLVTEDGPIDMLGEGLDLRLDRDNSVFSPNTINQYGVRLGAVLFVLFNAGRLSAFKEYIFLPTKRIKTIFHRTD